MTDSKLFDLGSVGYPFRFCLPMIIGYDFTPSQKISTGWLKGLIMLCFVSIHMRPRGGRRGILHMIRDGGGMRVVGQWCLSVGQGEGAVWVTIISCRINLG